MTLSCVLEVRTGKMLFEISSQQAKRDFKNVPSSHLYTNILYLFCFEVVQIKHKSFNEPRVMKSNAEDQTWYDPTAFLFLE